MIDITKEIISKFPKVARSSHINRFLLQSAKRLVKEDQINIFLKKHSCLSGLDFVEAVLDFFNFDFAYSSNDIENIPSNGKVVIIANHPLGALDALSVLKLVGSVRKDIKIVANDFLAGFDQLQDLFIQINTYDKIQSKASIAQVHEALAKEMAVIIFPAGEVSRVGATGIKDIKWKKGFLKFAQKNNAPILPIYIKAKNSKLFYTASMLNKNLSTLLLSSEMFKQKNKKINIKIGKVIPYNSFKINTIEQSSIIKLFKKHLYSLDKNKEYFKTQSPIAHPEDKKMIKSALEKSQLLGETFDEKSIYLYKYKKEDRVLHEIGRLREISFRKVDEGVNKKRDLDKYDLYYDHIVLWDSKELEIVGAYRVGVCSKILEDLGFEGFYTHTLFEFNNKFKPYLDYAIELGRSFVQPKYWGTRALDYLWFGIGAYLKKHPHIKYMYGPVSISGSMLNSAKELLVQFYTLHYKPEHTFVTPRNRFQPQSDTNISAIFNYDYKQNFKLLKSMLSSMDCSVPTLYKQYSELCEEGGVQFHGFNTDEDFANCIDGFIFVTIDKIKQSKKDRYINTINS